MLRNQSGVLPARRPAPAPRLVALLLLLAACAPESAPPVRDGAAGPAVPDASAPLPDTVRDTLVLEGMPEPVTLRRFRSPAGFPLPFHTYLPPDLRAAPSGTASGEGVRFVAHFGGAPREDVYLEVVVPREALGEEAARRLAGAVAARLGAPEPGPGTEYPWALGRHSFRAPGAVGSVTLGRHAGRHFLLITHFPPEAADGMGPRVALVLERWRWTDTGLGLDG